MGAGLFTNDLFNGEALGGPRQLEERGVFRANLFDAQPLGQVGLGQAYTASHGTGGGVARLQAQLIRYGLLSMRAPDGIVSSATSPTVRAVQAYATRAGLSASGIARTSSGGLTLPRGLFDAILAGPPGGADDASGTIAEIARGGDTSSGGGTTARSGGGTNRTGGGGTSSGKEGFASGGGGKDGGGGFASGGGGGFAPGDGGAASLVSDAGGGEFPWLPVVLVGGGLLTVGALVLLARSSNRSVTSNKRRRRRS